MISIKENICKPTFIIDKQRATQNISHFISKFQKSNTQFRPHFKTHQSVEVGKWFYELGTRKISVSSVDMAWQFYQAGWKDISIVFPFNRLEIDRINKMSSDAQINLLIEDTDTLNFISKNAIYDLGIFIKIDCGYHRTGIESSNLQQITSLAKTISASNHTIFKGILSHFGNTYACNHTNEVKEVFQEGLLKMLKIKRALIDEFPDIIISLGDTPSASIIDDFSTVDEMRPGNFVFYDWMQTEIGSCNSQQIAAIMVCPVVAKHKNRSELIVHGGAVHFSKEKGLNHFGAICDISDEFSTQIIEGCTLKSLSQEHGIVQCSEGFFNKTAIGDLIGIIPIHSCLTANLMKENTRIVR